MSLDQTALDQDWSTDSDGPDHNYEAPTRGVVWRDWSADPQNRCLGCGTPIDTTAAGAHGDRDGCVPACTECTDYTNLRTAVNKARGDSACGYDGGMN